MWSLFIGLLEHKVLNTIRLFFFPLNCMKTLFSVSLRKILITILNKTYYFLLTLLRLLLLKCMEPPRPIPNSPCQVLQGNICPSELGS